MPEHGAPLGAGITHSNIVEAQSECARSMYDVRLHVLSQGDEFELPHRRPAEVPRNLSSGLEKRAPSHSGKAANKALAPT
ncbi:MAG TPA: hypothetical protein VGC68_04720 [Enterovirga sp.]